MGRRGEVDGDDDLSGHVEMDETFIGGRDQVMGRPTSYNSSKKVAVFGMIERDGEVITSVVPDVKRKTLMPIIKQYIEKGTTISTDQYRVYKNLPDAGYKHGAVNHARKQWKNGIHHTNSIEGFWSRVKNSIKGTHIHVSKKHLDKYLVEFEYRYNMRSNPSLMFDRLLKAF